MKIIIQYIELKNKFKYSRYYFVFKKFTVYCLDKYIIIIYNV